MTTKSSTCLKYLDCDMTYEGRFDVLTKVSKFQLLCDYISRTFEGKTRRETQLGLNDVMSQPLCYMEVKQGCRRIEKI